LIEKLLPEEVLLLVLERLPITSLAAAQCVCRQWRNVGASQSLWLRACNEAFFTSTAEQNAALVRQQYGGSWKRMLLERPHLRYDGIYVSRNTYLRTGVVEWSVRNAVSLQAACRQLAGGALVCFYFSHAWRHALISAGKTGTGVQQHGTLQCVCSYMTWLSKSHSFADLPT
jgi:hypothetical protein